MQPIPDMPPRDHDRPLILVAGATGYVGGRLIPELLERGHTVRALCRTPAKLSGRAFAGHEHLEVHRGDVLDDESLDAALRGVGVAYYLVHSMAEGHDFERRDERAAEVFAGACARAGVGRIVYLSGLGDERDPMLSRHLASRHAVGRSLRSAGVPVTELRASIIVGSGSASFEIVHDLCRKLPVMLAPKWLRSRCEPIAIRDVVEYLVRVLDEPRTIGEVLDIGGGEHLTYQRMLEICSEELGRPTTVIPVPVLTPRLSSWWLHLVTRVDMRLARPLIEGLRNDTITIDQRITEWIPIERTNYRDAVKRALVRLEAPERWSSWRDARGIVRPAITRARYNFRDYRTFDTELPPEELFRRLTHIGGEHGYGLGVDALWRLRGAMDRVVGGPGLRRGRPRGTLHEGDPIDMWRVVRLVAPARMSLRAEMLVPGAAHLDFYVEPRPEGGARLHQLATLEGNSLATPAYWMALVPIHGFVFNRLGQHVLALRSRPAA
ncbi:MAG: hypothetical protein JWM86_2429 [Thermoleophilia bacterium]|nr:hypothetical protein [Thermoleophilia bacterium]